MRHLSRQRTRQSGCIWRIWHSPVLPLLGWEGSGRKKERPQRSVRDPTGTASRCQTVSNPRRGPVQENDLNRSSTRHHRGPMIGQAGHLSPYRWTAVIIACCAHRGQSENGHVQMSAHVPQNLLQVGDACQPLLSESVPRKRLLDARRPNRLQLSSAIHLHAPVVIAGPGGRGGGAAGASLLRRRILHIGPPRLKGLLGPCQLTAKIRGVIQA